MIDWFLLVHFVYMSNSFVLCQWQSQSQMSITSQDSTRKDDTKDGQMIIAAL
jgi:hypothetical protein